MLTWCSVTTPALAPSSRELASVEPGMSQLRPRKLADGVFLTACLGGAGLRGDSKGPLFRTIGRSTGCVTRTVLPRANAYTMIDRGRVCIERKKESNSMPVTSALALPNGKAYLFQGTSYSRYDFHTGVAEATAVPIADNWPNLPGNASDAALHWGFGKAYFFYGGEYLRYDIPSDTVTAITSRPMHALRSSRTGVACQFRSMR